MIKKGKYEDIIHLPHHVSAVHPPMPMGERAAQFSPFAALSGHGDAIRETARITKERAELDEGEMERLNEKLLFLKEHAGQEVSAALTYFRPDERKAGGAYVTVTGRVKKVDEARGYVVMEEQGEIRIADLAEIEI